MAESGEESFDDRDFNYEKPGEEVFTFFGEISQSKMKTGNLKRWMKGGGGEKKCTDVKEKGYNRMKDNVQKIQGLIRKVKSILGSDCKAQK